MNLSRFKAGLLFAMVNGDKLFQYWNFKSKEIAGLLTVRIKMSFRFTTLAYFFVIFPFVAWSSSLSCSKVFDVNNLSALKAKVREALATHEASVRNRSQLNETDISRMSVVPLLESSLKELSKAQGIIKEQTENLTTAQNSNHQNQQKLEQSRVRLAQLENRLENVKSKLSWFENLFNSKGKRLVEKIQKKIDSKKTDISFFNDKINQKSSYAEQTQLRIDEMRQAQDEIIKNYVLLKEFSQDPNPQNLQQLPESIRQNIDGINKNILQALHDLETREPEIAAEALKKIVADWLIENDVIYQTYQKIVEKIGMAQEQVKFLSRNESDLHALVNSVDYDMRTRRDMTGPSLLLRGVFSRSSEVDYQRKLSFLQNKRYQVQESKYSLSRRLKELRTLLNVEFQSSPQNIFSLGPNLLLELNHTYRAAELLNIELEKLQNYTYLTEKKLDDLYQQISTQQKKIVDDFLKTVLP